MRRWCIVACVVAVCAASPAYAVDLHGGRNALMAPGVRVRAEDIGRAEYVTDVDSTAKANALPGITIPPSSADFKARFEGSDLSSAYSVAPTSSVVAVVDAAMVTFPRNNWSAAGDGYGPYISTNYQLSSEYRFATTAKSQIEYRTQLGSSGWYDSVSSKFAGSLQSVSGETSGTAAFRARSSFGGTVVIVARLRPDGAFDVYSWSASGIDGFVSRAEIRRSLDRAVSWSNLVANLAIESRVPHQLFCSAFSAAASEPNRWRTYVERVTTCDLVTEEEADSLISQLSAWDAADVIPSFLARFGDLDPYAGDGDSASGDGPTLDDGASGFSDWADGLLGGLREFMPWVAYMEELH